ncbi:M4 family metallopeptidase [Hymenobacter sp. IS2118]|uniref:M4 family metallopeptidase n=1 Tax=Hymenobacter sp. IS2118 TaxID=1505605 RepID=UPI0005585BF6|nr:M4 family metallopeptidase [Hymenobacter sp. IS2118]
MKNSYALRALLGSWLAVLLAIAPTQAQVVAGRAAPTVEARKQVLREALRLTANADLRPTETEADPLGFVHEQYQLYYQGVKVEHGLLRIHSRAGKTEAVSGETLRPAAGLSVRPGLSEAAALQRALAVVKARTYKWQLPAEEAALRQQTGKPNATYQPKGELVLVGDFRQPEASRPLVLAWKFNIYAHEPVSRAWFYVDAQSGQVVLRDAIIKHLNAPGAAFATRYVGARTSITDNTGSGYRLRETATGKGVTTLNMRKSTNFSTAVDFVDNDNSWTAAEHDNANFDNAALDAHLGAQATQGYWNTIHGRDSYDDRGTVLLSYAHYGNAIDNAYWNGTAMLYGDGDTAFKPLTALDVCGHEIGHAVMQATANLTYQGESGALNEGFSDIWGCAVENFFDPAKQVYLIGEDITKPSFGLALRSMSNPNQFNQPDTYKGTNWYNGTRDNGGVHTNSGVLNFWFYLLSAGGAGTNDFGTTFSVTGISIAKAERIAYRAERFYMTPSTNYTAARQATMQAAIDLFGLGSAEVTATAQAWRAVGVGDGTGNTEGTPTLTSFALTSGVPGTVVTLTGTNIGAAFSVSFNGTAATIATLTSGTSMAVTVPAGATTGLITVTTATGTVSSATNFIITSVGLSPVITSFLPSGGQVQGGSVTITGTNLTGATAVRFNGTAAAFSVVNTTTLTTTVPVGATTGALTVTTPNGTATAPSTFLVLPNLSLFSPGSALVGATVTLTGTTFTGALNVKFNGFYATTFTVVNATTIMATVPNAATTGPITVRTPSGTATSATNFTVTPSLAFASFSPASGVAGTVVNVQGRGFTGTTAVTFSGVNAPTFTVASDIELFVTVPSGATTGNIVLTTPLGTVTSPSLFIVLVPGGPTITGFTPGSGPVGTSVVITGTNFTGATAVQFNGTPAAFTVVSATSINTTAPAGFTSGPISLITPLNTAISAASFMLPPGNDLCSGTLPVLACGSTVLGTTTGSTSTGDPTASCGTIITAGAGGVFYRFVGTGASVTLSTCDAATNYDTKLFVFTGTCGSYTCVGGNDDQTGNCAANGSATASQVTFASVAGTNYLVFVSGFDSERGNFGLTATCVPVVPTITSFTPTSGPVGTSVVITGTNLTAASAVPFNGTAATTFTVNSATSITATVPTGATTGPIGVTVPGGSGVSVSNFTVLVMPTLTSLNPTSGSIGTNVTLTGTGFTGATGVSFNGTAAVTFSVSSATTATATVPAGATSGNVTITTPNGTSNGMAFTVTAASTTITSIVRADSNPANAASVDYTVTFAAAVTGMTAANFSLTANGGVVGASVSGVSGAGSTYTVSVSTGTGDGTLRLNLANATGLAPGISNVPYTGGQTYIIDKTAPTATITSGTAVSGGTSSSATFAYTVTFPESVSGFGAGAVSVGNGSLSGFSGSGTTYTFDVTPAANGAVTVDVAANGAIDPAGNGNTAAAQYSITYAPATITAVTWTGAASSAWAVPGNWSPAVVPTAGISASIAAAPANQPLVSTTAVCDNLTLQAGARLTLAATADLTASGSVSLASGSTLTQGATSELYLGRNWTNNGATLALDPSSEVGFGGTNHLLGGTAATAFQIMTVGERGGFEEVLLNAPVSVAVKLLLANTSNVRVGSGGSLVLLSTATRTALVVQAANCAVIGTVTVQRAVSGPYFGSGYRHYSSPVATATVGSLATTGFTPTVNGTYNTSPTPLNVKPFPTVFSYDQSRLASAANNLVGFAKGWVSPAALSTPLAVGQGYTVQLPGSQTVAFTGALNNGDLTLPLARSTVTGAGLHLLGNPYPAPFDYSQVLSADRPNLDAALYVFIPTGPYAGTYRAYVNGIGVSPVVAVGQGFFTRVTPFRTSGSLTFRNAQRVTDENTATTFGRGTTDSRPALTLALAGASGPADELTVYAQTGATAGVDSEFDAVKLSNPNGLSLATLTAGGEALAIDGRPLLAGTVPLQIALPAAGAYTLSVASLANLAGIRVELVDNLTGTRTVLAAGANYAFTTAATTAPGRFWLNLSAGPLAAKAALEAQVLAYPNPVRGRLTIVRPLGGLASAVLYNSLGQMVKTMALPTAETTVDLVGLASGVYSLRLTIGSQLLTRKVVVE